MLIGTVGELERSEVKGNEIHKMNEMKRHATNAWMNERTNEWVNEWVNERMIEWMHAWMIERLKV